MADKSHTKTTPRSITQTSSKPSALSQFHLAFELDRTWSEAKQSVQHRPSKK